MEKVVGQTAINMIKRINRSLGQQLEALDLGNDFYFYLASYNYGDQLADIENFYYPHNNQLLTRDNLPTALKNDLNRYSCHTPFGLVLSKSIEMTIDNTNSSTIPIVLYKSGDLFGIYAQLGKKFTKYYAPPLASAYAGTRSAFCVSNLGNLSLFSRMKQKLPERAIAPKTLYEHHAFFKTLYEAFKPQHNNWMLQIAVFPGTFLDKVLTNKRYLELKAYLYNEYWVNAELTRNRSYYDFVSSEIFTHLKSFKPDPYTTGTISHFISLFLDFYPGFTPLVDETQMPTKLLQQVLIEEYGVEHNPIMIGLDYFKNLDIMYYSLNYPTTFTYSRTHSKQQTVTAKLDSISRIAKAFFEHYQTLSFTSITRAYQILPAITMHCFHTDAQYSNVIRPTAELQQFDARMVMKPDRGLPKSSPFCRGLIAFERRQ